MNDQSLNASFWLTIFLQTIGAVDPMPGTGPRKMPAPKAYVTPVVAWGVLQLAADVGYQRAAAAVGWIIVLASLVLGPFGKMLIGLFDWVSVMYGASNKSTTSTQTPGTIGPTPGSAGYQGGVI